jgi:hypothetical protein
MNGKPSEGGPRKPTQQPSYDPPPRRRSGYQRQSLGEAMAKSFIRSVAASVGRIVVRMITGRRG